MATPRAAAAPAESHPLVFFQNVRARSVALSAPLGEADAAVQSMPEASPTKWHLAHTTWFFEQFVLGRDAGYRAYNPRWNYLFNSYYQSVGPMHARPQRGMLTRPTLRQILDYRAEIDARMGELLARTDDAEILGLVTLGLHHEQQHQELILTDIKHLFAQSPLEPAYRQDVPTLAPAATPQVPLRFLPGAEGVHAIGHDGNGFAFDCETPRHDVLLHPHAIANRPITNAEFRAFIDDGGYREPTLWMAQGWDIVQAQGWSHPLYWADDLDSLFTLAGRVSIHPEAPVTHVSFFEADAFARWAGARLPSEAEWEVMAAPEPVAGNLADADRLHPVPAQPAAPGALLQCYGDVWEWTGSPYISYPGYQPLPGALGEYNGKFMCGQYVLRGGSCATPASHMRASYRNFFAPPDRWQFSGIRLAKNL